MKWFLSVFQVKIENNLIKILTINLRQSVEVS